MSGTIDKLKAKVEGVLHKDDTTTTTGNTHHTGTTGTTGHTTGHTSGTTGTTGYTGSDPSGPHQSHLGNKADPRVDSDLPGGAGNTTSAGGYGTGHSTGGHHTTGTTGGLTGGNTHGTGNYGGSDPTGPHNTHLANRADPRVDSDYAGGVGNTTGAGGYGTGHSTGAHHTGTTHTGGLTGGNTHGTTGGYSDPTGPHDSRLGNKADPRVDSDRVGDYGNTTGASGYGTGHGTHTGAHTGGTHTTGAHTGGTHTTGGYGGSDPTGPHDSRLANKADPRVDSDRVGPAGNTGAARDTTGAGYGHQNTTGTGYGTTTGTGGYGHDNTTGTGYGSGTGAGVGAGQYHHSGPGPAQNTAGPHKSDLLNKIDPRVDSDLDGSKTTGGNKTYSG